MRRESAWPLIGRDEELTVITDLLEDPANPGLVIAGDAGTGKSRLALETVALAREAGLATERVVATGSAATVPLGVFVPLLPPRHADAAGTFEGLNWAAEALMDRSQETPLVLVVDDAHHLDPASATLVHQLAVGRHVTVVVTVRTGEVTPDAVVALWKDELALRLEIQALSREETTTLIRHDLSGEVDERAAYELWVASGGNPLFLRELVGASVDGDVLIDDKGVWVLDGRLRVPRSIQDLVRQRLTGVAPAELDAMYTLAFADALGLDLMRALHPGADLAGMERRGLVRVDRDAKRRPVSLSHPMYGEVLRADAPETTAVEVARLLTGAIEGYGARRREDALQVASWQLVAGGDAEPGLLATAAQQAYHAADFDLAERLARLAMDNGSDPAVAVLLAQLLDEGGEHGEAERYLDSLDLMDLGPSLGARAALARSDNLFFGLGREGEAHEVLAEAERTFTDAVVGELVANRSWFDVHAGRLRSALQSLTNISRTDTRGLVAAGIVAAWARALLGDTAGALLAAEEAAALARPATYPAVSRHESFPELARGHALLHAGRLEQAEKVARKGQTAAVASRPSFLQARWTTLLGTILAERGLVITAAATFQQAAALQRKLGQPGLLRSNLSGQVRASTQAGVLPEAEVAMEELEQLPPTPERLFDCDVISAKAWIAVARGERSRAVRLMSDAAAIARESELVVIEARLQHDLVRLGENEDAAERLAHLAEVSDSVSCAARASHAAATVDGAGDRLEEAAEGLEQFGLWLLSAEAFVDAAAAYARSGRRRAAACNRRASDLLRRCEGARPPTMTFEDPAAPLTSREREVVIMAARGQTSQAIADRLVISVRTVNNLIQRAYIKLGVHNRRDAASVLGLDTSSEPGTSQP